MSISQLLKKFEQFGHEPMMESVNGICTYNEFLKDVSARKKSLEWEIDVPSVVALQIINPADALVNIVALALLKCQIIPFYGLEIGDTRVLKLAEFVLKDQRVTQKKGQVHPLIQSLKAKKSSGVIISTSGTTGMAKWLLHDFDELAKKYLKVSRPFRVPFVYKLDNVSGLETFLSISAAGGALLIPSESNPYSLNEALESFQLNADLISVTPSYLRLMMLGGGLTAFQQVVSINLGGEKLELSEIDRIKQEFPKAQIRSFYGTSETSSIKTKTLVGTNYISWGQKGEDFDVFDHQLFIKTSSSTMMGYLFDDNDFDQWYPTGDLVEHRKDGFYEVLGRLDFRINVGGKKVHPHEVEEVLMQFEGIETCGVRGEPNPILGQIVVADIFGAPSIDISSLRKHCASLLSDFKVPQKFNIQAKPMLTNRLKRG